MIFFHWPRAERLSADERDRRANAFPKMLEALRLIAKPALGGKQQQYIAQAVLKEIGEEA